MGVLSLTAWRGPGVTWPGGEVGGVSEVVFQLFFLNQNFFLPRSWVTINSLQI